MVRLPPRARAVQRRRRRYTLRIIMCVTMRRLAHALLCGCLASLCGTHLHVVSLSPCVVQGGGELCLVFHSQLPAGNKWITFMSQTRAEFTTTVEAYQENSMALRTFIPSED